MAALSRFRGRSAHVTRSTTVGTSWDTEIEPVYERHGNRYTAAQHYRRFGGSKLAKWNSPGTQYVHRTHCDQPIRIDSNGFAFCSVCNKVFNSGEPSDGDHPTTIKEFREWGPPLERKSRKRGSEVAPQVAAPLL